MDYTPRAECPVLGYAVDAMPSSQKRTAALMTAMDKTSGR